MKKSLLLLVNLLLVVLAFATGAAGNVLMAEGIVPDAEPAPLPDGGVTVRSGLTEAIGRSAVDGLYLSEIDQRITKIRPMSTPVDQISRYGKAMESKSFEVKYYTVSSKPIKTTLKTAIAAAQSTGTTYELGVNDESMFDVDDTIRVVGVKGKVDGGATDADEDLVLHVVGLSDTSGLPTVRAVNGLTATNGEPTWLPAIAAGTVLVRMGKACAEIDAQAAVFSNIPTPETQYCQNFMIQVEESTFNKIAVKEVNWSFSDLEEDAIYDMRLVQENSFLFGAKGKITNPKKSNQPVYFTGGIWWMAGKDITAGTYDATSGATTMTDDQLVDIAKDLFVGSGVGNKRKVGFFGSDLMAVFSKIKSERFKLKESVEVWNLKFKSFDTDFGEVLVMHHELFDQNGMSDQGLIMDPSFLTKRTFISWSRSVLELKKAGVRNTDAVVLQEVACLYLRYPKAHARIKLASA